MAAFARRSTTPLRSTRLGCRLAKMGCPWMLTVKRDLRSGHAQVSATAHLCHQAVDS